MQTIVNDARIPLNDDAKTTWSDTELFGYGMQGLRYLQGRRSDMYFGLAATVLDSLAIGGNFPLEERFRPAVTDYITARAQFKDDEAAVKGAAASFYALFERTGL